MFPHRPWLIPVAFYLHMDGWWLHTLFIRVSRDTALRACRSDAQVEEAACFLLEARRHQLTWRDDCAAGTGVLSAHERPPSRVTAFDGAGVPQGTTRACGPPAPDGSRGLDLEDRGAWPIPWSKRRQLGMLFAGSSASPISLGLRQREGWRLGVLSRSRRSSAHVPKALPFFCMHSGGG